MSLLLTTVISLVLLLGAFAFVLYEYKRESGQLRQAHELAVEQLSVSLTLPLWNYDSEQTQKILQGVMQDPETSGVSLRDARTGEILVAFTRGSNWAPVERRNPAGETNSRVIASEREIKVDGQSIGIVYLETTFKFLWKRMARWSLSTLLVIFILDGILIASVYFLIWYFVLAPLVDLEQYATGIGADGGAAPIQKPHRFQGEFLRLRDSLGAMVDLLQERYRTLERQAGFNRWLALAMERFATVEDNRFDLLFESMLGELTVILGSDQAFWMDYDPDTKTWSVQAAAGKNRDILVRDLQWVQGQPGQIWSDQLLLSGEILKISSRRSDPRHQNLPWESAVIAPLRTTSQTTEQTRGALGLAMVGESKTWDHKEVQCLVLFGNAASTARERHRAERLMKDQSEKLAEAYNLQRLLFDQAFQFIGLLSPDGILHRANETALKFAGVSEEQVLGKPFWDTPWWSHDENQRDRLKNSITRAAWGETVRFQSTHFSADGYLHQVDFSIKPVRDLKGNLLWLMPEGRDINDIAEAQKALLASEERYRSLFENAGDAILLLKDGSFQDCNSKALEIYRVTREQILGRSPVDFSPVFQPDGTPSAVLAKQKQDLALSGQSQQFEWQHLRPDGSMFDVEVTLNLLRDGNTPLLQAIVRDVTVRRHQEELNRRNAEALLQNDKLMALGELAAGMAHEITQPLSGISLAVQGLGIRIRRGPLETRDAESILEDVGGYVERIRRLIEHVRMFSRDRRTEPKSRFDARQSVEGALSLLGTQLRNNGIELVTRLPTEPLFVAGNLFELEQVFFNLLSNARYALDRRRETEGGLQTQHSI